ncbi:MAG: hypothetical protein BMS9Abin17_1276 [Acidimicrobiia bacterium]|nr:MAG: hypothetical protein BMS9Abin17_1276 [Acidimicrobiia bacterium]
MNSTAYKQRRWIRLVMVALVVAVVAAACSASSSDDSASQTTYAASSGDAGGAETADTVPAAGETSARENYESVLADDGSVVFTRAGSTSIDAKVIRDGRVDLRIGQGAFGTSAAELRLIAADLGGYVSSGESRIEEFDEDRYAVGWFTLRIPTDRFDDAVARIEGLGERVSSSLTSQDVTEEYVDLEGRLRYWRQQEAFYSRLMDEATSIEDLVTLQTRMQDVLLNIEQIEGRLRYLDSRTTFATLTVGLTEVPDETVVPEPVEPDEPGTISVAFEQAGEVLLATVAFLIVASAVVIPIGILALFAYAIARLFVTLRRKEEPIES